VSWWTACAHTPGNPAGIAPRPPNRCRRRSNMWGEWDVPVSPYSNDGCPHWGYEGQYEEDRSWCTTTPGVRHVSLELWDIPWGVSWLYACQTTPGLENRPPDECWVDAIYGAAGVWYISDPSCCRLRRVGCYKCRGGGHLALKCEDTCVDESGQYVTTERVCPEGEGFGDLYQCSWLPTFPYPDDVSAGCYVEDTFPFSSRTYVVQRGDTLSEIAVQLGTTVEDLAALNGIIDPDVIYAGQTIYY
jgi:LysM domain